ncbi:cation-translocating P-type ATPase [Sporosarcina ureilytica]|uniref:P-type Ca(2+) transporter n=1 Tax=Sporosarcina ureilytica TaxID=298596 RepID=A0A1D8JJD9_9BACL|nr:cation-translocating P-type ATPase [Sporosarcina ureilytica]AOV08800.1 ATPase [Sporosarcina ureilytica]
MNDKHLLKTNIETGLSTKEATARLQQYGPNQLKKAKSRTLLQRFVAQIHNVLVYVLIGAAIISGILGEVTDAIIIGIVVIINAVVGMTQESKANEALNALRKMSVPKALVLRDGVPKEIPSEQVVPGDVIMLDAGRYIPCDLQLVETVNLKIDEAALTGESVPVEKDAAVVSDAAMPIADRRDQAYMSTLVTYGRGIGIATCTGMQTEIGKVAAMLHQEVDELTPLQKSLDRLGKTLGFVALFICILIFGIGALQGRELMDMFLLAISLAVAAIPEGMPAIVSIVLAIGVQRMIKRHVIIRKLPAVETLGSVSVICSDKTGTLTQNRMAVMKFHTDGSLLDLEEADLDNTQHRLLFQAMSLCNDATYSSENETGDPTEIALLQASASIGLTRENQPRIDEIPFDSNRKLMTTIHQTNGDIISYTKGAIDQLLDKCTHYRIANETRPMTDAIRKEILHVAVAMSQQALRVLGAAYRTYNAPPNLAIVEEQLIYVGLVGMIDPPREEVKDAIQTTKVAGIRTVMITGDHQDTAFAIAKELGIASDTSEVIAGKQLDELSDAQLKELCHQFNVYARVTPEHKVRIVQALKANDNTVSMTGDGVNDAPSLKAADIGVAMGITGTDVAKGAADMVLTDDNFSSIVKAVEEGRTIYRNIKKSIVFLLSCNLGELIALFIAMLFGWPVILRPIHILWINLVTDTFPALSLGVDPEESDVMNEKPRDRKEHIFAHSISFLVFNGLLIGLITLIAFVIGVASATGSQFTWSMLSSGLSGEILIYGQTMAFLVLSFSQLAHAFNLRSMKESVFKAGILKNKWLVYSVLLGIALQLAIVSIGPVADLFSVQMLGGTDWLIVVGLSVLPLLMNELIKAVRVLLTRH